MVMNSFIIVYVYVPLSMSIFLRVDTIYTGDVKEGISKASPLYAVTNSAGAVQR